jgi:hypothetical protein
VSAAGFNLTIKPVGNYTEAFCIFAPSNLVAVYERFAGF